MKILGICGSHRKEENTFKILKEALKASKADTEIIQISDVFLEPCRACYDVCSQEYYTCVIDDDFNKIFEKMREADGIILASPKYVLVPSRLIVLMERFSCLYFFEYARRGGENSPLAGTPCGVITVSGSEPGELLKGLAHFVLMLHMDLVTLYEYPYFGVWAKPPVEKDEDGMQHARKLGEKVADRILKMNQYRR